MLKKFLQKRQEKRYKQAIENIRKEVAYSMVIQGYPRKDVAAVLAMTDEQVEQKVLEISATIHMAGISTVDAINALATMLQAYSLTNSV